MTTERLDLRVPDGLAGERVDRVVATLAERSRAEVRTVLEAGGVRLDGATVTRGSTPVASGQRLEVDLPARDDGTVAPDPGVEVTVVLEDPDFVVVDKAPEVVVHPGAGQREGTLVAGLLARYPEIAALADPGERVRPGIVHRLDKGTSGLLVVARSARGLASLREQMAGRAVSRIYSAFVQGHVAEDRGVVDAPIGRSARQPTAMAVREDGRPARTRYHVRRRYDAPYPVTELEVELETGRTHQIRVHLASIGHPVVNDPRYGHRRDGRLAEGRVALHASALSFTHPRTGEPVRVTRDLPADLAALRGGTSG
ncbi:MAG TPA: RluA family pseudouridine synthase [Acidimicrobiales bacterium]|nr:MAG: hypothetical protein B7Z69_08115 [Actinobacteria bacterium 21-73-9]HQU26977.1 RluA family pseudouridine synthase [Acidimicrobiales bacterium]